MIPPIGLGAAAVGDLPLVLLAVCWGCRSQDDDGSARLERIAASVLMIGASAALWNALPGPQVLWAYWPLHLLAALGLAAFAALCRGGPVRRLAGLIAAAAAR